MHLGFAALILSLPILVSEISGQITYAAEFNEVGLRCPVSVFETATGEFRIASCSPQVTYFLSLDTQGVLHRILRYPAQVPDFRLARVYKVCDEDPTTIHTLGNQYPEHTRDSVYSIYTRLSANTYDVLDTVVLGEPYNIQASQPPYGYTAWKVASSGRVEMTITYLDSARRQSADIYGYDCFRDSLYKVAIPFGKFYGEGQYSLSTSRYFHFWQGAFPMVSYDRLGNYVRSFDLQSLNNFERGYGSTGIAKTSFAYFDSSLYLFAPTRLFEDFPTQGIFRATGTFMQVIRLSEDYVVQQRVFTDTLHGERHGYQLAELNEGASATPDGKRLYAVAWDANDADDTIRWHIYRFTPGMTMLPTLEIVFPETGPGSRNFRPTAYSPPATVVR